MQYLCTLVCGELLRQFDSLSADMESTNPLTAETIILGLGAYFFSVNFVSKKNCAIRCRMRKPRGLKVRQYAAHLIDLNEYLVLFPGAKLNDRILIMDLNVFFKIVCPIDVVRNNMCRHLTASLLGRYKSCSRFSYRPPPPPRIFDQFNPPS